MIEPHQRQMAHAHAVMARGSAMPPDGMPSADILDSWVRCMQTGLDARATTSIEVVEAADLAERRERAGVTRHGPSSRRWRSRSPARTSCSPLPTRRA